MAVHLRSIKVMGRPMEDDGGDWQVVNKRTKEREKRKDKIKVRKQLEKEEKQKEVVGSADKPLATKDFNVIQQQQQQKKENANKKKYPNESEIDRLLRERDEREKMKEATKVQGQPKKKKAKKVATQNRNALETAASNLSPATLQDKISEWSNKEDKKAQLHSLADYFMNIFKSSADFEDITVAETWDYGNEIYDAIDPEFVEILCKWFSNAPGKDEFIALLLDDIIKVEQSSTSAYSNGLFVLALILSRNFPKIVFKVLPKSALFNSSQNTITFKKSAQKYLFSILSQILEGNVQVALLCWFRFCLNILSSATDKNQQESSVSFLEAIMEKSSKNEFNNLDPALLNIKLEPFIELLYSTELKPNLRDKLRVVSKKVFDMLMTSPAAVNKFLPSIYPSAAMYNPNNDDTNALSVKLLSLCLLKGARVKELYHTSIFSTNNALLFIAKNWDSLSKEVPKDKLKKRTENLIKLSEDIEEINDLILQGKYTPEKGITIAAKSLKVKKDDIENITSACRTLRNKLTNVHEEIVEEEKQIAAVEKAKKKGSSVGLVFMVLFLLLLLVVFLFKGDIILEQARKFLKK